MTVGFEHRWMCRVSENSQGLKEESIRILDAILIFVQNNFL